MGFLRKLILRNLRRGIIKLDIHVPSFHVKQLLEELFVFSRASEYEKFMLNTPFQIKPLNCGMKEYI
jgi:hypothetical protein